MGKTRNGILITIIMTLVCAATLLCGTAAVRAEGSRDLVRTSGENAKALGITDPDGAQQSRWNFMAMSGSFMGVNKQQKIKFYAFEGEVVFLGSNEVTKGNAAGNCDVKMTMPDGAVEYIDLADGNGHISTKTEETGGPKSEDGKAIKLPNSNNDGGYTDGSGFTAYKFEAKQSGVYILEFHSTNTNATTGTKLSDSNLNNAKDHVKAWDVTVAQPQKVEDGSVSEYKAVNGRVWMDAIGMQNSGKVYGDLYCVTRDGYIWRFSLNGIEPNTFAMYANSRGGIGTGTNASAYHSVHSPLTNYTDFKLYKERVDKYGNPDGIQILGPDNDVTDIDSPYHMFVNPPDTTISESIVLSKPKPIGAVKSI